MTTPCVTCVECDEPAVSSLLVCRDHMESVDAVRQWALKYAVASILYYRHAASPWRDAHFDGVAYALLKAEAWKQVPWLEQDMLRAGSGYDLDKFPSVAYDKAREILEVMEAGGAGRWLPPSPIPIGPDTHDA